MKRMKGLTEGQTETLLAIGELNKKSRAFKTVDEVARQRLITRYANARARYFEIYRTTTYKMLEELTRKGYVDQSERLMKRIVGLTEMADYRPYKITKKGKEKLKRKREAV